MPYRRSAPPTGQLTPAILRILIASYFIAVATGLALDPGRETVFAPILPAGWDAVAATVFLYLTGFMIMVGRGTRTAALLLGVYLFWTGFMRHELAGAPTTLSEYWSDMALVGAVLLLAGERPARTRSKRLFARRIAPRRIDLAAQASAARPRPALREVFGAPDGGLPATARTHATHSATQAPAMSA